MYLTDYEGFQLTDSGKRNTVWDPQGTWAAPAFELFRCCLLRTLMSYNGQETTQGGSVLRPDLASGDPEISADGLTWTFHLKPGLRYAPPFAETTIVAADFIRALERTLKPDPFSTAGESLGAYPFFYGEVIAGARDFRLGKVTSISGLQAPDANTLVVHLLRPAGDLAARLSLPAMAPIPPGAADGHDPGYGPFLVASGPYMIEGTSRAASATGYVPGKSLTLIRNPSWQRSSDDLRNAYVDRIEISNLSGRDAEDGGFSLVLSGKLDVVLDSDLSPSDLAKVRAQPALADRLHFAQRSSMRWISMNLALPPLDDIHVRQAINYIVDKSAMAKLFDPTSRVETHAIPDSMEAGLLTDYDPFATPDHAGSLEKAKAAMALSRYDTNHDGVCDSSVCKGLSALVRSGTQGSSEIFHLLRTELGQLGITLKDTTAQDAAFFGRLFDPKAHVGIGVLLSWQSDYLNGSNWFGPLASSSSLLLGGDASLAGAAAAQLKSWGYSVTTVPGIDTKIQACIAEAGLSQDECWAEADQFLTERVVPWVPLLSEQASRVTSDRLASYSFDQSVVLPALDQIALK